MKAVIINEYGGTDKLQITDVPKPEVGEAEVLVKIKAIGVNPVDWKIRQGGLVKRIPHQLPIILGWDMAGEVETVGFSARRFQVGDQVYGYCRRPIVQHGTYAEYIALPESYITRKPQNMPYEQAASVPLAALTAYQSIYGAVNIQQGETILILGASGGVGSFAVQLAKVAGVKVIGLASKQNHDYLRQLGADEIIDYQEDFVNSCQKIAPDGVDVIFDCFGDETLQKSYACIKKGGRMVSLRATQGETEWIEKQQIQFHYVFVEPNVTQLEHITQLIEAEKLSTHISHTLSLDEVAKAHELSQTLHTRGKIVLSTK